MQTHSISQSPFPSSSQVLVPSHAGTLLLQVTPASSAVAGHHGCPAGLPSWKHGSRGSGTQVTTHEPGLLGSTVERPSQLALFKQVASVPSVFVQIGPLAWTPSM